MDDVVKLQEESLRTQNIVKVQSEDGLRTFYGTTTTKLCYAETLGMLQDGQWFSCDPEKVYVEGIDRSIIFHDLEKKVAITSFDKPVARDGDWKPAAGERNWTPFHKHPQNEQIPGKTKVLWEQKTRTSDDHADQGRLPKDTDPDSGTKETASKEERHLKDFIKLRYSKMQNRRPTDIWRQLNEGQADIIIVFQNMQDFAGHVMEESDNQQSVFILIKQNLGIFVSEKIFGRNIGVFYEDTGKFSVVTIKNSQKELRLVAIIEQWSSRDLKINIRDLEGIWNKNYTTPTILLGNSQILLSDIKYHLSGGILLFDDHGTDIAFVDNLYYSHTCEKLPENLSSSPTGEFNVTLSIPNKH